MKKKWKTNKRRYEINKVQQDRNKLDKQITIKIHKHYFLHSENGTMTLQPAQ